MVDTSRIHALVARGRRRLKVQSALETGTLAAVLAAAAALVAVYAVRRLWIEETLGIYALAAAGGIIVIGLIIGYFRQFPTPLVATRIDRASGLSDRMANACEFEHRLRVGERADEETLAMMRAAVADAVRAVPKAHVKAATPLSLPRDARPALAFLAVSGLVAALYIRPPEVDPVVTMAIPAAAPPGAMVELRGGRFCGPTDDDMRTDGSCVSDPSGIVFLGESDTALEASVVTWRHRAIEIRIPADATIGKTVIRVRRGDVLSRPVDFEVLDPKDERALPNDAVVLEPDDVDFKDELLDELRQTAQKTEDLHLEEFVNEVEDLLEKAENGEISKQDLIDKLAEAEQKYMEGSEENVDEQMADLKDTGKELKKEKLTKELGDALEKGDLEKAQEEFEKLADKMEKGELSEKEQAKVAEALEKAADKFEQKQDKQDKQLDKQISQKKEQLERLQKKMDQAKTEREKQELARQKQKQQRELDKLKRDKEQQEKSAMRRQLKSLHRNMKKSAESMKQQGDQQQKRKYASENLRNAKQDTGKVEDEQRKVANQKKVASQMSDLKEAMRRAKRKGKGGQDRFGKNGRNDDFRRRARGQKGNSGAWRPGATGKGKGQGKGQQNGGKGDKQQQASNTYGEGHDPNMTGDPTGKGGHTKDEQVQGTQGRDGTSTRETILSAAQKGFSNRAYGKVYGRYKAIVEEVIKTEKVPSGYKYYVKKYFQKIKPHAM